MRGKREQFVQTLCDYCSVTIYTSSKTPQADESIEMRTELRKRNEKDERQRVYRDIQRRQTTGVHGLLN